MDEATKMLRVQGVIIHLASRFCRFYPSLDRGDMIGEAQIVALKAIRTHQPKSSNLETWVWTCLFRFFVSRLRSVNWRRSRSRNFRSMERCDHIPELPRFNLAKILWQVSEEAASAIGLAIDYNLGRSSLVKVLIEECGWSKRLITKVFREVREVLYDV